MLVESCTHKSFHQSSPSAQVVALLGLNIMDGKTINWGICAAGKICNDFTIAINSLPNEEHKIGAIASSNLKRAEEFAKSHAIPKAYGSYEELAKDNSIDVVYVGVIHTSHYGISRMLLENGKNVLCEKPLCVNVGETKSLLDLAKSKNLFLMEGIWSRTFPLYTKLKEMINEGVLGEVRYVWASFGGFFKTLVPRVHEMEAAGGALLDLGIYPVQLAQFIYNDEKPLSQTTSGCLLETGVDAEANIVLQYSNNRTAVISTTLRCQIPRDALVCGTKGYIRIHEPMWCPEKMTLHLEKEKPEEFFFKLPDSPTKGSMFFTNSQGLQYEASAVRSCILGGLKQSPVLSHDATLLIAEILQKARHQIGYCLPQDAQWKE